MLWTFFFFSFLKQVVRMLKKKKKIKNINCLRKTHYLTNFLSFDVVDILFLFFLETVGSYEEEERKENDLLLKESSLFDEFSLFNHFPFFLAGRVRFQAGRFRHGSTGQKHKRGRGIA